MTIAHSDWCRASAGTMPTHKYGGALYSRHRTQIKPSTFLYPSFPVAICLPSASILRSSLVRVIFLFCFIIRPLHIRSRRALSLSLSLFPSLVEGGCCAVARRWGRPGMVLYWSARKALSLCLRRAAARCRLPSYNLPRARGTDCVRSRARELFMCTTTAPRRGRSPRLAHGCYTLLPPEPGL